MLDLDRHREMLRQCSIAAALEAVGERWSFLILRGAFNGLQHFEEIQAGLGIARNILSDRLTKLVNGGILKRSQDDSDRRKVIYSLTEKGEALLPVLLALRQWGEAWGNGPAPIVLADRDQGRPIRRICVQAQDGRELQLDDLMWVSREECEAPVSLRDEQAA